MRGRIGHTTSNHHHRSPPRQREQVFGYGGRCYASLESRERQKGPQGTARASRAGWQSPPATLMGESPQQRGGRPLYGLHLIRNPSGTYSFVGTVPVELA